MAQSESSTLETDVCIWCYALVVIAISHEIATVLTN